MSIFNFTKFTVTFWSGTFALVVLFIVFWAMCIFLSSIRIKDAKGVGKAINFGSLIGAIAMFLGIGLVLLFLNMSINDGMKRQKILDAARVLNPLIKKGMEANINYYKNIQPVFSVIIDGTEFSSDATIVKSDYKERGYLINEVNLEKELNDRLHINVSNDYIDYLYKILFEGYGNQEMLESIANERAYSIVDILYKSNNTGAFFIYSFVIQKGKSRACESKCDTITKVSLNEAKRLLSNNRELYNKFIGKPDVY